MASADYWMTFRTSPRRSSGRSTILIGLGGFIGSYTGATIVVEVNHKVGNDSWWLLTACISSVKAYRAAKFMYKLASDCFHSAKRLVCICCIDPPKFATQRTTTFFVIVVNYG